MLALAPACFFLPAGSYAISLVHRSQISGDHRQAGGRNQSLPGATNTGHMKGPVMQPELFVFPISPEAQARLNRIALRGALDSMVDVMTDLRKLSDEGFAEIKAIATQLVGLLNQEKKAYRGKVA